MKTYKVKIKNDGSKLGYYYAFYDKEYELRSLDDLLEQLKEDGWNENFIMSIQVNHGL